MPAQNVSNSFYHLFYIPLSCLTFHAYAVSHFLSYKKKNSQSLTCLGSIYMEIYLGVFHFLTISTNQNKKYPISITIVQPIVSPRNVSSQIPYFDSTPTL